MNLTEKISGPYTGWCSVVPTSEGCTAAMSILLMAEHLQYKSRVALNGRMFTSRYTKVYTLVRNILWGLDTQNMVGIFNGK
jgi:hypothetical protein